jgi:cytochrome P450
MHIVAAAADTWSAESGGDEAGAVARASTETLRAGFGEGGRAEGGPQPFGSIPGPKVLDAQAYNARNHQYILELHEQYGDIVAADISSMARADVSGAEPTKRVVFVRDPDLVGSVLRHSEFAKTWDAQEQSAESLDYVHNLIQPLLTGTVFNKQGVAGVHPGRLALRPMFNAAKQLSDGFAEQIDNALDAWPVDGRIEALGSCHDLIRQALLAAMVGSAATRANAATEATFHEVMDYFVARYASSGHDACATAEDEATMAKAMDAGLQIVRAWREHGKGGTSPAEAKTMLAVMAAAGNTDEQMAAMVINAIIAGAEAPASTLAHLLQEMAFNPSLQTALAAEVAAVAPAGTEVVDALDDLELVESCVMEALRIFAPATLVQRVAIKPTQLGGYEVPAGTVVGICITAVHRDPKTHQNPWAFDHRRKLNLSLLKKDNCFATFGGGPRGCPGKYLGKMLLRIALAKIVQRSEFYSDQRRKADHLNATPGTSAGIPKFVEWQVSGIPLQLRPQSRAAVSNAPRARRAVVAEGSWFSSVAATALTAATLAVAWGVGHGLNLAELAEPFVGNFGDSWQVYNMSS